MSIHLLATWRSINLNSSLSKRVCTNHDYSTTQIEILHFLENVWMYGHTVGHFKYDTINSKHTNCFPRFVYRPYSDDGNSSYRHGLGVKLCSVCHIELTSYPGFLPRGIHLHNTILLCRSFWGSDPLLLNAIAHARLKGRADVCMDDALMSYWVIKCSATGNA